MADPNKDKDKVEQSETTTAASASTATTTAPTTVYDPTDILIDEQTIEDINDQYKENVKTIETGYKAQEDAVNKAYGAQMGGYDAFLGEVGKKKGELSAQDADAQRRANAYRYIVGVGDAISGVANLVGTAHGAANQQQEYNAPGVMAKAEEQRKARKLEMDKLNERMNELKAQRTALQGERDLKLGELAGSKASDLATAELKRLQGVGEMKAANTKAKAQLAVQGMKSEDSKYRTDNKQTTKNPPKDTSKMKTFTTSDNKTFKVDVSRLKDVEAEIRTAIDKAIAEDLHILDNSINTEGKYFTRAELEQYKQYKDGLSAPVVGPNNKAALDQWYKDQETKGFVGDYIMKITSSPVFFEL